MTENYENVESAEVAEVQSMAEQAEAAANGATETKKQRATAANFLPIVSGRLPLLFVHAIRFGSEGVGTKDLASKFSTSVGKVFDIRKNKNFSYIEAGWKPTQADVDTANGWIEAIETPNKHGVKPEGNAEALKSIVAQYVEGGLATADEAAAQQAAKPVRSPRKPKAETAPVEAAEGDEVGGEASADDLLN